MFKQEISRRAFLGGVAVAGAGSSSQPVETVVDRKAINIGVITEPTASHRTGYLNVLAKCDGVNRVAVADPTGKTLDESRRLLGDRFAQSFVDPRRMLEEVKPPLTVVTLEGHHSPAAIELALRAGSHVLTEKPACTKLEDFERVAQLAEDQRRQILLAMATRSSEAVKKARSLIRAGLLGKPYAATMDWIADQTRLTKPAYHRSWLSFKKRAGGGKLIFHGIHYLDVLQFLVGDSIREINGFCQNVGGQPIEVEDAAVVSFRFPGGMLGTLNTGYYLAKGKQSQIRIWGSQGWLHLDLVARKPLEWRSTHPGAPRGVQYYSYSDEPGLYSLFFQSTLR